MRIDKWLELKRTKAFCVGLATLFAAEQAVWGADVNALYLLRAAGEQERQLVVAQSAAVMTIYDDLYGRSPTTQEFKEALEFLKRSPQMAHLVERLAASPESRWRLRQLNPERIKQRKAEAARISQAASRLVGDFLRNVNAEFGMRNAESGVSTPHSALRAPHSVEITPGLAIEPDPTVLAALDEPTISAIESWLADPQTLCSNCAPNALAPMLSMVGVRVSRETLTTQAFLTDYLSGNLEVTKSQSHKVTSGPLYISMDTVQKLAQGYGLTLNAVELTPEELFALRRPMIAALDLTQDGQADHYVVVTDTDEARVAYRESDGTRETIPTREFLRLFTRFALLPAADASGRLLSRAQEIGRAHV